MCISCEIFSNDQNHFIGRNKIAFLHNIKSLVMENSVAYYENKKAFHLFVTGTYPDLARFKREDNKAEFNSLLLKVMPEVKRYIIRKLNTAMQKRLIPRGKYKPEDFTDQLFIEVYNHFDEIKSKKNFHPWLFNKADALLNGIMADEEFDTLFLDNIDSYARAEWDSMAEKYSTDGDGDLVMMEELDDISYRKHDYILKNIFIEDNNRDLMAKLDKDLGKENIRKHTEMVLHHLPTEMRMIFELFTEHQFDVGEIAKIQNRTVQEIEQSLEAARKSIEISFYKRFINK
jgi:DNA-directed RNA polymerase specialized sigma24 family protein